jgi:hypothetical protein
VLGVPVVSKEILSQRTADYQNWVEAFARGLRRLLREVLREHSRLGSVGIDECGIDTAGAEIAMGAP